MHFYIRLLGFHTVPNSGPLTTFFQSTAYFIKYPFSSTSSNGQLNPPQGNPNPSSDKATATVSERFDSNQQDQNQYLAPTNPDAFFVPADIQTRPTTDNRPQQPQQNQQSTAVRPQQNYQQSTATGSQQQYQQNAAARPQQDYQQNAAARPQQPNQYPTSYQNHQSSGASLYSQGIHFKDVEPTTFRPPPNFDRTSMMSSEEFTQKPGNNQLQLRL